MVYASSSQERRVEATMRRAAAVMHGDHPIAPGVPIRVGVDLGTAFSVILVTDADGTPLVGASTFADVVRDGVVWDFAGAIDVIRGLRAGVERRCGRQLTSAAVTIPPGVGEGDHRAHRYVLEGAGIDCTAVVDEPTAANAVLGLDHGAVVDIGGGTTGVAVLADGRVVHTFDEPSGGTHMSLVIAGALKMGFDEAELLKRRPDEQRRLLPLVAPVLEKVATIVRDGIAGRDVDELVLVGGTCAFPGIDEIMTRVTGVPARVAPHPMYVTPLGVASHATTIQSKREEPS